MSMLILGLATGGLLGYFRFGDSIGWGVALGVGVALILGGMTWKIVHDPGRIRELTEPRASLPAIRGSVIRLALPWVALGVAGIAGVASRSATVFAITFAAALAASFVVRRFIPR